MIQYDQWLNRVFGRNLHQEGPRFDTDATTIVEFIETTLRCSGTDLLRFSDKQVNNGLNMIFNPSYSSIVFALRDSAVPVPIRTAAVLSIKDLYVQCFTKRVSPTSPLNGICFMLWDVSPIGYWGSFAGCEYFDLTLEVLESALYLPNPACVKSALHGLGHIGNGTALRIHRVIDRWATQATYASPELRAYAHAARSGNLL